MRAIIYRALIIILIMSGLWGGKSLALAAQGEADGEKSDYIGSEECGNCHLKAYRAWETTRLAKALITLGPRKSMKTKKKIGLDPYGDYTKEPGCLKCHTTGFELNKDGSYSFSEYGIGCEACHGPGKNYARIMKIKGRNYKREELVEAGLNLDLKKRCLKCHNEESPVIDKDYVFSHKERYKQVHGNVELKYHKKVERFVDEDEK